MIKRNLAVAGLALLLSACGFQLRGTGDTSFALDELNLEARDSYGETATQLEELLKDNGVRVYPGARYTLDLVREQTRQRTASYTTAARSAEYELTSVLDYEFRGPQNTVLLQDSVEVQKVYVHDSSNLIGSDQEAGQLRQEMRREVLQQLSMRIRGITPAELDRLQQTAEAKKRAEAEAIEAQIREQSSQPQQSPIELPIQ
ncbi:LPS assembly lipoprotein LptE [Pseudomonas sp. KSR10]|jgi:LPS-assembly lipoprotein|uniref:LPS-assembly lipoprotein LptE n=1 Tax=Stutzerimonas stutzeri TaxID=316 RepID=A0A0D9AE54_STUST|nr:MULTISPECIES: LPS assembly lipoprotein LptE [Pseudomonadaceae]KJH79303.1 lipoprotein [Stutzerimonas stutzeri]MCG6540896.1 LPS assembly lipoprotein LptE [Pseudomonas sp. KSR10]